MRWQSLAHTEYNALAVALLEYNDNALAITRCLNGEHAEYNALAVALLEYNNNASAITRCE